MQILLAVSADGFFARGIDDDMSWTSTLDKKVFRLITSIGASEVIVGSTTAKLLPNLPGRKVIRVSKKDRSGISLALACANHPEATIIGGPTVAFKALLLGVVSRVIIHRVPCVLGDGISARPVLACLPAASFTLLLSPELTIEVYESKNVR